MLMSLRPPTTSISSSIFVQAESFLIGYVRRETTMRRKPPPVTQIKSTLMEIAMQQAWCGPSSRLSSTSMTPVSFTAVRIIGSCVGLNPDYSIDLKPENLLFRTQAEDADIMIADFGLSRVMEEEKLNMLTEICGTPGVCFSFSSCIPLTRSTSTWHQRSSRRVRLLT